MPAQIVSQADVEAALKRVEAGESSIEDANLLRGRLSALEAALLAYQLGDDELKVGGNG